MRQRILIAAALVLVLVIPAVAQNAPVIEPGAPPLHERTSDWSWTSVLRGGLGVLSLLALAWLVSLNRRKTPWRVVAWAVGMQVLLGLFLIKWDVGRGLFEWLSSGVVRLLSFADTGARFVFGNPSALQGPGAPALAFSALGTVIFFSCLMAVLYHLRIMHLLIWALGKVMSRVLGVSGAEAMAMAANIFAGQTEAPLVVSRFIPRMTRSELMALMTGGFATIAGSVMAAYIKVLSDAGGAAYAPHLLIASVMSAPAAFAVAKIILPETEKPETGSDMQLEFKPVAANVLDAATTGVADGVKLWLNIVAMLLAFIAMVELVDALMGWVAGLFGGTLTLKGLLGTIFAPLAIAMGVETGDAQTFGSLLGIKVGVNEFIAYGRLQEVIAASHTSAEGSMSPRSIYMATYALCGFANFSSIGIQIGGISPMAPDRRRDIIGLAMRAMIGGALASWMTASIAGMFF